MIPLLQTSFYKMIHKYLLILIFITPAFPIQTLPKEDFYHAAVVEYCPLEGKDPYDSLMINAKEYTSLIAEASKKADIVVFPENGLFHFDRSYTTFIEVPFGNNETELDSNVHPALLMLSQAAQKNSVYVLVNLHEKFKSESKTLHYNTNIVLNRNGDIIARYRKTNLFGEPLNITRTPEHIFFDSDFGVRFGMFTCFDILFKEPTLQIIKENSVTDILYPTYWYSGLPFFTAVQTQAGWAYATDTNLLAAGGNSVSNANTGSGIYAGKKGPIVYLQSQRNQTVILHAKVIKKGKQGTSTGFMSPPIRQGPREDLKLWDDLVVTQMNTSSLAPNLDISSVDKKALPANNSDLELDQSFSEKLCHNGFCCIFNISATFTYKLLSDSSKPPPSNPYLYKVAVFNGIQSYSVRNVGVQFCAIVSCLNESLSSCGKPLKGSSVLEDLIVSPSKFYLYSTLFHNVTIQTSSLETDSFTFPDILELSENPDVFGSLMNISQFSFSTSETTGELNFTSEKLVTAALYTRVFSRDDPLPVPSSSYISVGLSIFVLLVSLFYCTYCLCNV